MSMLVLDIAAVPDTLAGTRLYGLSELTEADTARVMNTKNREKGKGDELPLAMQRILAISCLVYDGEKIRLFAPGEKASTESEILAGLQAIMSEEDVNRIIAWNGNRFDFPLLNFRCLVHAMRSPLTNAVACSDLSDILSVSNAVDRNLSLHETAILCGFPGAVELSSDQLWERYRQQRYAEIRENSELRAINCWLVYLNWRLLTGSIDETSLGKEHRLLQDNLILMKKPHLTDFVQRWADQ